jgi:hypothetical protein
MVALSNTTQEFTVTTNDEVSHDFVWSVNNVEVRRIMATLHRIPMSLKLTVLIL